MMSRDWVIVPLGKVVTLQRGYDLPNQLRRLGEVPIITSSGIGGTHSEAMVYRSGKNPAENHGARLLGQSAAPFCWYRGGECGTISCTLYRGTEGTTLCYSLTQGSGRILPAWETYRIQHARRRR